ncbi:MAG: hypothetical protein FWE35_00875 [Streptosporangiales bacterium]|nr:hypothetical protein [Streptosporangiales bacterium]
MAEPEQATETTATAYTCAIVTTVLVIAAARAVPASPALARWLAWDAAGFTIIGIILEIRIALAKRSRARR